MLYFLKRVSGKQARSKIHDFTGLPGRIISVVAAQEDMVPQRFYAAEIFRIVILVDGSSADNADTGTDGIQEDIFFAPGFSAESGLIHNCCIVCPGKQFKVSHIVGESSRIKQLLCNLQLLICA